ncbi:alcohol dehydrogenase catalytic domain-containing protein [Endozoicomonas arenosclerae]|uniref:alcohol dehydrogenase catalytic domain-containing protein n=1 Tax=Endozoicomonas arenosclerae TaxID=1633495 RepID=UPI000780BF5B|nr:zinc-binding dehydrogenase [Endozoicomonas arenosclerae]
MKAVTYSRSSDAFKLSTLPVPELQSDYDVLVKVKAVALNPVDCKVNFWHTGVADMDDSFVGGLDVSGEIAAVGDSVTDWAVGDQILYHGNMYRKYGGFAEYALHDSRTLIQHPDVAIEYAAATPCAGWTAFRALTDKLNIHKSDSLFIAGASGGVGSFAVQLADNFGVNSIIVSCSARNREFVEDLGATDVIDYTQQDVFTEVMKLTDGKGVHSALDSVGGDNDILCASVLGFEGAMCELVRTVRPEQYPDAFAKGLSFHQLSLGSGHGHGDYGRNTLVRAGEVFSQFLANGHIRVPELNTLSIEDIPEALIQMRNQRTVGKLVALL